MNVRNRSGGVPRRVGNPTATPPHPRLDDDGVGMTGTLRSSQDRHPNFLRQEMSPPCQPTVKRVLDTGPGPLVDRSRVEDTDRPLGSTLR